MPERVREDLRQIAAKAIGSTRALDEIVWAVDPQADTLESLVNYACTFATELLALAEIRCRLHLPADIPQRPLQANIRHNFFLAFKETINNIVKHATASEVQIKMKVTQSTLIVTVSDDGKGLPLVTCAQMIGESIATDRHGLANMRSRPADIGGR